MIDPATTNERARTLVASGRDLLMRRNLADMDRAIACFEAAIEAEPRSPSAHSSLTMACMGRHMLSSDPLFAERALRTARAAIELSPASPMAQRAYAWVCATQGRFRETLEHAFRALELGIRNERVYCDIGFAWRMQGRPDLAIRWYDKARISQSQPSDYNALLGDCYLDLGLTEPAQRYFEVARLYLPDQPEGWIGLCHLKLLAGETDAARSLARTESPKHPGSRRAAEMVALIELFARNYSEAEQLYSKLAALDASGGGRNGFPGAADYRSALARLKLERGDTAAAEALLEASIAAQRVQLADAPGDAEALYRFAAANALRGQSEEAFAALRAAADAGWLNYRATMLDPRFDAISQTPAFRDFVSRLATRVTELKERHLHFN